MPNVSNVFGITLWAIDQALNNALVGLLQFQYHSHDRDLTHYPPIIWRSDTDDTPTVQPLWYALKFFAIATANYSQHVKVDITGTTNKYNKVWALISKMNVLSVVILHKDLQATTPANVSFTLPSSTLFPIARAVRLESSSPYNEFKIQFAGQTYDGSSDGTPVGDFAFETVTPSKTGTYTVFIQPISSILITMQVPTTAADYY